MLAEINRSRGEEGRAALQPSDALSKAAQARAAELSAAGTLDSAGVPGEDLLGRAKRAGYPAASISEIAVQSDRTPLEMMGSWRRDSPSIWKDLTDARHRDVGIGVAALDGVPLYVFLLAVTSGETFATRTRGIRDSESVRRELLESVNRERKAHGLAPLRAQPLLQRAAQAHADDMLARGYYGHASPEGAMVLERARRAGYPVRSVGENIAKGQTSVKEVMEDWIRSPEHRKNILDPFFRDAGFGFVIGKEPDGGQVLWVQVFGEPRANER